VKGFRKIALLLFLFVLTVALAACFGGGSDDTDRLTYTVDWGGEDGKITYQGLKHDADYGWIMSRDFYTLEGVFTQPNGQGTCVFDVAGNLLVDEIENDGTYYAYWKPITVVISLVHTDGARFDDGTFRKEIVTDYEAMLPTVLPIGKDEYGFVHSRWYSYLINGELCRSKKVTDDNGVLNQEVEKVSDLCTQPPKDNMVYTVTLWSTASWSMSLDNNRIVTLDFGAGVTEKLQYRAGEDLTNYHLWYEETGDRELVGWATHPTERGEYVTDIENLSEDVTLYAVWRYYRDITLHIHNGKTQKLRVYQNEPLVLFEAPALVGTGFENWYTDSQFNTVASRIITYENAATDYYAKYVPKAELDEGSHRLTLAYGEGVTEEFEVKAGQTIDRFLRYEDTGERELLGWLGTASDEYVTGGELTQDTVLSAVWKEYRVVRFHIYNGKIKTDRVYEGVPYELWTPGVLREMEFDGWYLDPACKEDYASFYDGLSYETAASDYYAAYVLID